MGEVACSPRLRDGADNNCRKWQYNGVHKITCFRDYCNCKDSFWRVCIFSSYRIPFIDIRTRLSEGLNLIQISPFPELINFNILRVLRVLNVSRVLKVVAGDSSRLWFFLDKGELWYDNFILVFVADHLLGILRPSDSEDEHACERAVVVALIVGFVT